MELNLFGMVCVVVSIANQIRKILMTQEIVNKILALRSAPKSPSQLRKELTEILDQSFIVEVMPLSIVQEENEFELVIRARVLPEDKK